MLIKKKHVEELATEQVKIFELFTRVKNEENTTECSYIILRA